MNVNWSDGERILAFVRSAPEPDTSKLERALQVAKNRVAEVPESKRQELLRRLARKLPRPRLTAKQTAKLRVMVQLVADNIPTVYDDGWEHWKVMMEFLSSYAGDTQPDAETRIAARRGLASIGMLEECLGLDLVPS